jgi:(4-(4-[2-(gamma-L-glutamylamino)ethyl]phenoxymethyl)furan-2-yl)methanamine synthase
VLFHQKGPGGIPLSLGIDIGGANTKAATSDGRYVETVYLPLWRDADLKSTLEHIKKNAPGTGAVGVTITGELADCYPTKKDGIDHIARTVKSVFPGAVFYGSDGCFYDSTDDYRLFSAANWSASARYIGRVHGDVLFVDIGSTTTDIIPVVGSIPVAGATDFERLARSELIYAGALRTNLAALLHTVEAKGCTVRTASELFAITADVYLLLGRISPEDYTCDAPDGGRRDQDSAARRVARLVCCDLSELDMDDIRGIAMQAYQRQLDDLTDAIRLVSGKYGLKRAAICGMGAFLARDALFALEMPCAQVSDERISKVFPAYAVASLLEDSTNVP